MRQIQAWRTVLGAAGLALASIALSAWPSGGMPSVEADSASGLPPAAIPRLDPAASGGPQAVSGGAGAVESLERRGWPPAARHAAIREAIDWGRVAAPPQAAAGSAATEGQNPGSVAQESGRLGPWSSPLKAPLPVAVSGGAVLAEVSPARGGAAGTARAEAMAKVQSAALDKMANDFTSAVAFGGQDPGDAAYAHRWSEAQEMSDADFRAKFGWDAFMERQLANAQQSLDN